MLSEFGYYFQILLHVNTTCSQMKWDETELWHHDQAWGATTVNYGLWWNSQAWLQLALVLTEPRCYLHSHSLCCLWLPHVHFFFGTCSRAGTIHWTGQVQLECSRFILTTKLQIEPKSQFFWGPCPHTPLTRNMLRTVVPQPASGIPFLSTLHLHCTLPLLFSIINLKLQVQLIYSYTVWVKLNTIELHDNSQTTHGQLMDNSHLMTFWALDTSWCTSNTETGNQPQACFICYPLVALLGTCRQSFYMIPCLMHYSG